MSLEVLLFDVDGTLADTESTGHRPAYNEAFDEYRLPWNWNVDLYRELLQVSGGRERLRHYIDAYAPDMGAHRSDYLRDPDAWVMALHQAKTRYFTRRLENGQIPLRDGAARLMREAGQAGLRIAIVTNASRLTLAPFLEYALGAELAALVELCVCGDEVARKKPAPDVYEKACERLGCAARVCLAIEDSHPGARGADAAGIPVLVTVNDDTRDQNFDMARAVVYSLGEPGVPTDILRSPGFDFDHVDVAVLRRLAGAC